MVCGENLENNQQSVLLSWLVWVLPPFSGQANPCASRSGKAGENGCTNTAWWVLEGVGWPKPALDGWNCRTGSGDLEQGHRKLPIKCSKPKYRRKVLARKDRLSPGGSAVKSSDTGFSRWIYGNEVVCNRSEIRSVVP